jgi:uncharacterized protein YlxW (UPF0749 family)
VIAERIDPTVSPPQSAGDATNPWVRALVAATVGLLVVALVTANRSAPVESRLGQRIELVELIEAEQARNAELAARVDALSAELAALERDESGGQTLTALSAAVDELAAPAGMQAVAGPGVIATLRDSRIAPPPDGDYNDYVIHEQDLQAVINALWAGGAEAMSVNGNRILTTTAIRCVGNVLLLHGTTHSPPYEIAAIGDVQELQTALTRDPAVARFADAVARFKLGYTVDVDAALLLPGFEGVSAMQVARPVDTALGS